MKYILIILILVSVVKSSKILVALGNIKGGSTNNVELFDVNDKDWNKKGCAYVENYSVSDWGSSGLIYNDIDPSGNGLAIICGGDASKKDCYTIKSGVGKWTKQPNLMNPRANSGSVFVPQKGWWLSGGNYSPNTTEIFTVNDEIWRNGPALKRPLKWHCVIQINDDQSLITGGDSSGVKLNEAVIFDWLTQSWKTVKSMKYARYAHVCGKDPKTGTIIVAGGFYKSKVLKTTEIYDTKNNKWVDGPELPVGLDAASLVSTEDGLILTGGFDENYKIVDTIYKFDLNKGWIKMDQKLKLPRMSHVSMSVADKFINYSKC